MAAPIILNYVLNGDGELRLGASVKQDNAVEITGLNFDLLLSEFGVSGGLIHFDDFQVTSRTSVGSTHVIVGTFTAQGLAIPGSGVRLRLSVYNGMGFQDQVITVD